MTQLSTTWMTIAVLGAAVVCGIAIRPAASMNARPALRQDRTHDEASQVLDVRAHAHATGKVVGSRGELEAYWQECGPVDPDHLEPLLGQLRDRLSVFERACAQLGARGDASTPADNVSTPEEYYALYSKAGLKEASFLVDECVAGRIRKAPAVRVPATVLSSSHPSAQLIPHLGGTADGSYIARLDKEVQPALFEERARLFEVAQRMTDARELEGPTSWPRNPVALQAR